MEISTLPLYQKRYYHKRNRDEEYPRMSQNTVGHLFSSQSLSNLSSAPTSQRVTYRRLEKIASYHYLPRVVYSGPSVAKSQSHRCIKKSPSNSSKYLPHNEFGSLDSLDSVSTFSYFPSRGQRERQEDIYELRPPTIVICKKKPTVMLPKNSQKMTCIKCHRPKIIAEVQGHTMHN